MTKVKNIKITPLIYLRNPKLHSLAKVVGQITSQVYPVTPNGTGFLICSNPFLILTNYHIFDNRYSIETRKTTSSIDQVMKTIENRSIQFGYYKQKYSSAKLIKLNIDNNFCYSTDLDYAIIGLSRNQDLNFLLGKKVPIQLATRDITNCKKIGIIQHVQGSPKSYSVTTDKAILNKNGDRMLYSVKTGDGSSGSPIFDNEWKVIALNHSKKNKRLNEGIPINSILNDLQTKYSHIHKIIC